MSANNFKVGIAFLDNGAYAKAVEFLTKHINDNPEDSEAYENRAIAYYHLKEDDKSLEDLEMAIDYDPGNENAHINKGLHYLEKDDKDKALESFLLAYTIYAESRDTLSNLVSIYFLKRDFKNAKQYSVELLNQFPEDEWAIKMNAYVDGNLGNHEASIKGLAKVLQHKPDDADVLNAIGYSFMKLGELDKSEKYYNLSSHYDPEFAYPVDNLGHLEYLRENYDKAFELINKSIDMDASNSYAYKNRALVYLAIDNKDAALKDLEYALELGFKEYWGDEVDEIILKHFKG
jgi:Flp pilus assembly protein TadD